MAIAKREKRTAVERMAAQDMRSAEAVAPALAPATPVPAPGDAAPAAVATLQDLGLPSRALTLLTKAGVDSPAALARLSTLELGAVPGMGAETLLAIRAVVPEPTRTTTAAAQQPVAVDEDVKRAVARAVRARRGAPDKRRAPRPRPKGADAHPNHCGKRSVQAWLSVEAAEALETEWRAHREVYAQTKRGEDPSQAWGLTKAHAAAALIDYGLERPEEWLATVLNDGRIEAGQVDRDSMEKVGFLWPASLLDRLQQATEDLTPRYIALMESSRGRGRYALTRANMITAILTWGAEHLGECVLRAANDDRLSGLHPEDRRTRPETWRRSPVTLAAV